MYLMKLGLQSPDSVLGEQLAIGVQRSYKGSPTSGCKCARACVRVFVLRCLVFSIEVHLGNFLPLIIDEITGYSKFLQCYTDHFTSFHTKNCINLRNES